MVLRRVLARRPITALCGLCRLDGRLQFLGGARQAPCGGRKEGPQGREGSVTPLRCVYVEP